MSKLIRSKWYVPVFLVIQLCTNTAYADTTSSPSLLSEIQHAPNRSESNIARDTYRHPEQTLAFFEIKPDMTAIEIWPGMGWYSEILAPWFKQGGGHFIAAGFPLHLGPKWRQSMAADYKEWLGKSPKYYDQVQTLGFGPPANWKLGKDESADAVMTFRNVHNWVKGGYEQQVFSAMFDVLKSGGILGVTDHRAAAGTDLDTMKKSGYLTEKLVIDLAEQAGFVLEASSEINANALDTMDATSDITLR